MNILRPILTFFIGLFLVITLALLLQAGLLYTTLYNEDYVIDVMNRGSIINAFYEDLIEVVKSSLSETLDERLPEELGTFDPSTLLDTLDDPAIKDPIKNTIESTLLGVYGYYILDNERLPNLDLSFTQSLLSPIMDTVASQALDNQTFFPMDDITEALESLNTSGQLETIDADLLGQLLEAQNVELSDEQSDYLTTLIEDKDQFFTDGVLDQSKLQSSITESLTASIIDSGMIAEELDLHDFVVDAYRSEDNPILSGKLLTRDFPKQLVILLGLMVLILAVAYLSVHRYRVSKTLKFITITGIVVSSLSLVGDLISYLINSSSNTLLQGLPEDFKALGGLYGLLTKLLQNFTIQRIKITLIVIAVFLVILILVILKDKLYPSNDELESQKEVWLQLLGFLIVIVLAYIGLRWQYSRVTEVVDQHLAILKAYEHYVVDMSLLIETLIPVK